jgi:formylglycine-generating enzyme required for sulfatase activity
MKYFFLSFILVIALTFYSCVDLSLPTDAVGVPKINSLNKNLVVQGDTLIIYGEFFDISGKNNSIVFSSPDGTSVYSSDSVLNWQIDKITIKVIDTFTSGSIQVRAFDTISSPYPITINQTDNIQTVTLGPAKFLMGSLSGNFDEDTVTVKFTKSFLISTTEVTQRLYQQVINSNTSLVLSPSLPVYNVTFEEAVSFCNRLSEIQGFEKCYTIKNNFISWNAKANGWRLPTEAEWEFACRGGTNQDYPLEDMSSISWYNINSGMKPHPVANKNPNSFGIFDMNGNVREWCWDYYSATYPDSPATDPKGPADGTIRVTRGGCYADGISYLRSSNRRFTRDANLIGIRLARNP